MIDSRDLKGGYWNVYRGANPHAGISGAGRLEDVHGVSLTLWRQGRDECHTSSYSNHDSQINLLRR